MPLPPEIIAPAWPILFPGGAVLPAINPTTGFEICSLTYSDAISSALPPISPIIIIDLVFLSFSNASKQSIKLVPFTGSPPIPIQVDCPRPFSVTWLTASYVKVPDLEITPTSPLRCICPGIIPTLLSPGVIIPGQFGPMSLVSFELRYFFTFTISSAGIPSVIPTINSIPESAASIMASAAKAGGTKTHETLAPASTASFMVSQIGNPNVSWPPFPGVTPPTTLLP